MLELKLSTPFKNAPIFYKPETESTMIDARNLVSQGFPSGTLIVTSYQIAGRGRFPDRKWESPPGESLLCTLILRTSDLPTPLGPLSLKAALSIATLLEDEFELNPSIKWPNDVLLKERKVAGILVETKDQAVLIGMGINCLQKSFPKELRKTATSIRKVSGKKFEIQELISPLLTHLYRWIYSSRPDEEQETNTKNSGSVIPSNLWKTEIENRLYRKNESVWFQPGIPGMEEPFAGKILGISEEGLLLIQPEGSAEIREFAAGEILFLSKR
ncbi:MAG: biotin--[acetyl-CoA-carboxylase] ligase [Spirochaetes bacterium]|nr:biotin--[acetyl-CoA-carboxylase] ligase [Spirochaetota bacterium]